MKYLAILLFSAFSAGPALADDCVFYKQENQGEPRIAQLANTNLVYKLPADWNAAMSSVWVKQGYYAILFSKPLYQGSSLYLYGSGLAFANNAWQKSAGYADPQKLGTVYNLTQLNFNDIAASVLCLKV